MIQPDMESASPNWGAVAPTGRGVVIHSTRSGRSMYDRELEGTLNWFGRADSQVSSHWVIGRDGTTVRVVPDHRAAWHAGEHNSTHWGIELAQGIEADGFTAVQLEALVAVCRGYVEDFGVPVAHAMDGFIGHEETPQGIGQGKSDPGRLFPWAWFLEQLGSPPLPTNEQAAHALGYAYVAFYRQERSFMNPFDRDVVRRVAEWLNDS